MRERMHTFFGDGIGNVCVYLLFEALRAKGNNDGGRQLSGFLARLIWPECMAAFHPPDIFTASR
eukprot:2840376-Karenia_brevis.AAC.1